MTWPPLVACGVLLLLRSHPGTIVYLIPCGFLALYLFGNVPALALFGLVVSTFFNLARAPIQPAENSPD